MVVRMKPSDKNGMIIEIVPERWYEVSDIRYIANKALDEIKQTMDGLSLDSEVKKPVRIKRAIKRRVYDPSRLYPDEDEVYEFYIGRSDG